MSPTSREDHRIATPPLSPELHPIIAPNSEKKPGHYRYLRGDDIGENNSLSYDFTIVAHRSPPVEIGIQESLKRWCLRSDDGISPRDGVQRRVVEKLVENGLNVDILDAGLTPVARGGKRSEYFVLLIRAPDDLVSQYAKKMNLKMWMRSGLARELQTVMQEDPVMHPADRVQVVDHIIREGAGITENNPYVKSLFPIHDQRANEYIIKEFLQSGRLEFASDSFINQMRVYFGEKVAYYFAFLDFYNKSLFPIAILGVLLTVLRPFMGTKVYMRILVLWGILVSVIWSFWFLKSWQRRNNELNYLWQDCLHGKNIMYPNPRFRGKQCINPVTGEQDLYYAKWRRYPKYVIVMIFMLIQIIIMMLFIACWITVFEVLKVRYPESHIFSVQWFCILGGGITFGLFVDVFQWKIVVTTAGKFLTEWENWKTVEQYERSLIRKLFLMDFLNYYTWFFLLAFAYVIPGVGDTFTNMLNSIIWNDTTNCCFGPYLATSGRSCTSCPRPWNGIYSKKASIASCVPCTGWATFDRSHLDLEQLFVTPIIVTQGLNLLIAVLIPWLSRKRQEKSRRRTDQKAMECIKAKGARKIIAELEYRDDSSSLLSNLSAARYIENTDDQVEALNALAREVLFQSGQDNYDPYDDYHLATVQYGFVVMFSMLWPLMPIACILINALKMRSDGFRLCQTLKRPFPRKASGIGEWQGVLLVLGCTGVIVCFALIFVSTGALEFFSPACVHHMQSVFGKDLKKFRLGSDFSCFSLTDRVVMLLICEHIAFAGIWIFRQQVHGVPRWMEVAMLKKEFDFKSKLYTKSHRRASRSSLRRSSLTQIEEKSATPPRHALKREADEHQPLLLSTKRLAAAWDDKL